MTKRVCRRGMNNKGVMLIEASIYMPLMIIMVVGIIMLFIFKLNKIYGQSVLSRMDMELQLQTSRAEKQTLYREMGVEDASEIEEYELLASKGSTAEAYFWADKRSAYRIQQTDYETHHAKAMFDVLSKSTLHGYLIMENPDRMSTAARDVALFRSDTCLGSVVEGKTGYTIDEYIMAQYGY